MIMMTTNSNNDNSMQESSVGWSRMIPELVQFTHAEVFGSSHIPTRNTTSVAAAQSFLQRYIPSTTSVTATNHNNNNNTNQQLQQTIVPTTNNTTIS
jgi:hypothetical protein